MLQSIYLSKGHTCVYFATNAGVLAYST